MHQLGYRPFHRIEHSNFLKFKERSALFSFWRQNYNNCIINNSGPKNGIFFFFWNCLEFFRKLWRILETRNVAKIPRSRAKSRKRVTRSCKNCEKSRIIAKGREKSWKVAKSRKHYEKSQKSHEKSQKLREFARSQEKLRDVAKICENGEKSWKFGNVGSFLQFFENYSPSLGPAIMYLLHRISFTFNIIYRYSTVIKHPEWC